MLISHYAAAKAALFLQNRSGFEGFKDLCLLAFGKLYILKGDIPLYPLIVEESCLTCFRGISGFDF